MSIMKKTLLIFLLSLPVLLFAQKYNDLNRNGRLDPYENPDLEVSARVSHLLKMMTVEEKVGQMAMTMGWPYYEKQGSGYVLTEKFEKDILERHIGGTWALMRADPWTEKGFDNGLTPPSARQLTDSMQRWVRQNTRLGIPLFFAEECPHGHMAIGTTVFPTGIGRASTFYPPLEEQVGVSISRQAALQGAHLAFGPVVDIVRDPRWSRVEESYGEDPCLSAMMAEAFVTGCDYSNMVAVPKHFTAYGTSEGGHNGAPAHVGRNELLSVLSYPFMMPIKHQHMQGLMTAYNDVDGVPCTGNEWLLKDVLRKEWGFQGMVMSDLFAIDGLVGQRFAADKKEAAAIALKAGVNIDLGASCYAEPLLEALKSGLVTEQMLDEAVRPILEAKFKLGLFDSSFVSIGKELPDDFNVHPEEQLAAYVTAAQSVVMLKNENGLLPLSKDIQRIAVIGPNADNLYNMLGDYTAPQREEDVVTVLEGIRSEVPKARIDYVKGCAVRDTAWNEIDKAVRAAAASDVVVMVLGGSSARDFSTNYQTTGAADASVQTVSDMESGEGFDKCDLALPGLQLQLLEAVCAIGKPVVLVMIQGRPLDLTWADANVPAILNAWYPGSRGGEAIADILFGDVNPSGHLPISYPKNVGQLPVYYNNTYPRRDYTDGSAQPLYPFGYGLSYTHFEYSDLKIEKSDSPLQKEEGPQTLFTVSFTIKNAGNRQGFAVPQLYLRDEAASVIQPERRMCHFSKVDLKAGESRHLIFHLTEEDLMMLNGDLQWVVEPGTFTLMVGESSQDIRLEGEFEVR